jgi:hypothetical protein
MAMVRSEKYVGVYLNHLANDDITYYIKFKDENGVRKTVSIGQ